jgi:hypothetical protein
MFYKFALLCFLFSKLYSAEHYMPQSLDEIVFGVVQKEELAPDQCLINYPLETVEDQFLTLNSGQKLLVIYFPEEDISRHEYVEGLYKLGAADIEIKMYRGFVKDGYPYKMLLALLRK